MGWFVDRIQMGARISALVQTGCGSHPALYNGNRVILGVKWPGHEINHPPSSNAEVTELVDLCVGLYSLSVPS